MAGPKLGYGRCRPQDGGREVNEFKAAKPLEDRLSTRIWKRAKQLLASGTLALGLAGVPAVSACMQNDIEHVKHVVTQAALTDDNGHASFEMHGHEYEINITDFESGERVPRLLTVLSANEDGGVYFLFDTEGRYGPTMTGVQFSSEHWESSGSEIRQSNVVVERPDTGCNEVARFFTSDMAPWELFDDRNLPDEDESVLRQNFELIEDPPGKAQTFPLRELDDTVTQVIGLTASEVASEEIGGEIGRELRNILINAGIKLGETAGRIERGTNFVFMISDACAMEETLGWGRYYRSMCYEDDDQFEIWKLWSQDWRSEIRPPWLDLGDVLGYDDIEVTIATNPIFIILPVSPPRGQAVGSDGEWNVPMATLDGRVLLDRRWNEVSPPFVSLEHIDREIPTLATYVHYDHATQRGRFAFGMSTCENYNLEYDLSVIVGATNDGSDGFIARPSIWIRPTDGEHYETAFYPDEECSDSDYFTSYGIDEGICNFYDIAVSCFDQPGYEEAEQCGGGSGWRYPGYRYNSVKQTRNGEFIVAAYDTGGYFAVRRINSVGSVRWTYTADDAASEANDVVETTDGNFVAVGSLFDGSTSPETSYDIHMAKLDEQGELIWEQTFGTSATNEYAYAIQEIEDGNYIITGVLDDEILAMVIDQDGDIIWQNRIDVGSEWSWGNSIEWINGEYVISGGYYELEGGNPIIYNLVLRANESGEIIWRNDFDGSLVARFGLAASGGQFVVAGSIRNDDGIDQGLVVGVAPNGSINWEHRIGGGAGALDDFCSVAGTSDNGVILAGTNDNTWLMLLDQNGDTVWAKEYGGNYMLPLRCFVRQTFDGGFIIAGMGTESSWLVKTDSEGNFE